MSVAWLLPMLAGVPIGLVIGLIGGGGSILAVPLLLYAIAAQVTDRRALVGMALRQLDGRTRDIGVLHYLDGFTQDEGTMD